MQQYRGATYCKYKQRSKEEQGLKRHEQYHSKGPKKDILYIKQNAKWVKKLTSHCQD